MKAVLITVDMLIKELEQIRGDYNAGDADFARQDTHFAHYVASRLRSLKKNSFRRSIMSQEIARRQAREEEKLE